MGDINYINHIGYYEGLKDNIYSQKISKKYLNTGESEIAEIFDETKTYFIGDRVYYNNVLYKFTSNHSAGAWSYNDVVQSEKISQLLHLSSLAKNMNTAGFHNGIYRGKDITSYLTDGTLWNRINGSNGYNLFDDLYLGDYIAAGNNSYAIVDFDYYIRCGNTDLNEPHLVMMPTERMVIPEGTALYGLQNQALNFINTANAGQTVNSQENNVTFKWNILEDAPNTNTTAGGYKYSRMRTVIMKAANTIVVNTFGAEHIKPIAVYYPNPVNNVADGITSDCAWFDQDDQSSPLAKSICDLPNETQVYGQQIWGKGASNNPGYEIWLDKFQFSIFKLQRAFCNIKSTWWLRSVFSSSSAANVYHDGTANPTGSAHAFGIRPRFVLVGPSFSPPNIEGLIQ